MAFVAAGAISKANATDPKKSALVRCARTDKGVHAAGNILSLKLIIEDNDIVQKINENLPSQIRVWGIQPTTGSFSAYQLCDSRIYEYLIPTHCFLPPPPQSFLGKSILELAEEADDLEGYKSRQAEVAGFWSVADAEYIKPAIDKLDPELASQAMKAIFDGEKQLDQGDTTTAFSGTRESAAESIRNSPPRDFHEQGALRTTTTLEAVVGTVGHSNDEVTPSVQAIRCVFPIS